ncbi:hypothetical protein [Segatella copri]|uniref:hypothetical protein n=1 Tax=Segatella copri TaxID=165179 RepID=UPI003F89DC17
MNKMKKHETKNFWTKTALFLICCVITSNVYAQVAFSFWNYPKEVQKLVKKCYSYSEDKEKSAKKESKILELYQSITKIDSKNKAFADCVYGDFLLTNKHTIDQREQGLNLIENGIKQKDLLGNVSCAYFCQKLGDVYLNGTQEVQDIEKGYKLYQEAQELNPVYYNALGIFNIFGIGTPINIDKGIEYLNAAIESVAKTNFTSRVMGGNLLNELYETKLAAQMYINSSNPAKEQYRKGMVYLLTNKIELGKDLINQAAQQKYEPAIYRNAILNPQNEQSENKLLQLGKSGYLPAAFYFGNLKLANSASAVFVAQVKKAEADIYPLFQQLADLEYQPAQYICVAYQNGSMTKEYSGSVFDNVLSDLINALPHKRNNKLIQQGTGVTHNNQNTNTQNSKNTNTIIDVQRISQKEKHYKTMCKNAEYWLKNYHEADNWIKINKNTSKNQLEYKQKLEQRLNSSEQLKRNILPNLRLTRKQAVEAGGNIPKSSIESAIEAL